MSNIPLVAIVGRANVGKSSVFNRLVGQRQAIVADEPGTTRDSVFGRVEADGGTFTLADTAGLKSADDEFEASIQDQIAEAAAVADLILVVIDATTMLAEEDRRVAKLAHKAKVPLILVVNKAESEKIDEAEIKRLGIKQMVTTSATQNRGFGDLTSVITKHIKPVKMIPDGSLKIALVGRPNVGKSSLFNALASSPKAVVDDVAGTTRDVNRLEVEFSGRQVEIMDTAGIRRSGKIGRGIERFSVLRAVSAIDEADVAVLVLDATEPAVTLDQKLAGMVKDAGKGLILAVNKWDLIDKDAFTHDEFTPKIRRQFQHVPWAMYTVTSAVDTQNLSRLLKLALQIDEQRKVKLSTPKLNRWLGERINHHPPAGLKNTQPKLKYVTQTGQQPPEITIFGRDVRIVHWSYKRYLERELREEFGLEGTPVIIRFSDRELRK
ncbi:MAG TPA: ribosome biogenesis GTPase Der [Candidatus Saccharimonadales bacterium]